MMNRISKIALAAAVALGAVSFGVIPAMAAQEDAAKAPTHAKVGKKERDGLIAAGKAVDAKDAAGAAAALAAVQPLLETPDGRYNFGLIQVKLGILNNDKALQLQGLDAMTSSGSATGTELMNLLGNQAAIAFELKDDAKAEAALTRMQQLAPNDSETIVTLAQLRSNQNRIPEALTLIDQAMAANKAAGKPIPENWYKFALSKANAAKLTPQVVKFSREWVAAYPTPQNWRDSLLLYRRVANPERSILIDIYRLLRFQKAMNGEGDYYMLANALSQTGYPGEVKAVLDEGVAANAVNLSKEEFKAIASTAARVTEDKASLANGASAALAAATGTPALKWGDAYFGYGDYAKAAELYKAALQKGGVDASLVNTHLGMALAMTGDKAGADAAFKAVSGQRADLAGFLLVWLAQKA